MSKEEKIKMVMDITGCNEQTALGYLIAEEWIVHEAVVTLKGDLK